MSEILENAASAPGAVLTDLFTATRDCICTVTINNSGSVDKGFRLTRAALGVADAASHYRAGSSATYTVLPAGEQMVYTFIMKATDKIRCYGEAAALVFQADVIGQG